MYDNRYLYPVTVTDTGEGCVLANGKSFRVIGNLQVKPGDTVYTDGRIVYGHSPVRQNVNLPTMRPGVPFVFTQFGMPEPEQGYFTDRAIKKLKILGDIANKSFLVNSERKIFFGGDVDNYALDAEVLTDEKGNEVGFSYAYAKERENICSLPSRNNSKIYIENSLGTSSTIIDLANDDFYGLVAEDVAEKCECTEYEMDPNMIQCLYFRFTDKKGNWELIAGVSLSMSVYHELPNKPGEPLYDIYTTVSRTLISRGPLIGRFFETETTHSVPAGNKPATPQSFYEELDAVYAVIRYTSTDEMEIIHRNYKKRKNTRISTLGWDTVTRSSEGVPSVAPYLSAVDTSKPTKIQYGSTVAVEGTVTWYSEYFLTEGSEDPTGAVIIGWAPGTSSHVTTSHKPITQEYEYPSINIVSDVTFDLPDGYKMRLDSEYKKVSILQASRVLIASYPIEHECFFNKDFGLYYGNYGYRVCWMFPHVCLYEFKLVNKIITAEYANKALMVDEGTGMTRLCRGAANMRLRRMRKIVRSPIPKINNQDTN